MYFQIFDIFINTSDLFPTVNRLSVLCGERNGLVSDGQIMVIVWLPPPVSGGTWSSRVLEDALRFRLGVRTAEGALPVAQRHSCPFPYATQRLWQNVSPTVPGWGASVNTNHMEEQRRWNPHCFRVVYYGFIWHMWGFVSLFWSLFVSLTCLLLLCRIFSVSWMQLS